MSTVKVSKHVSKSIHVMHVIDKLSVSGSGIHGITKAIEWWIPRFDTQSFRFSVCSLRAPEPAGELFEAQGTPIFFLDRSKFDIRTLIDLLQLVKREKVDILHLHGYASTNFGRLVSLVTGVPNIVHEHTVIDDQPLYQTIADWLLSPLTSQAIAISQPVYEFMVHRRKINPTKLDTFFYGLPLSEFQAPQPLEVQETRNRLGISPEEQIVCNVGRLATQKGQKYLLQAALIVLKERPKTRFLIVGEGPERKELESFVTENGIEKQVILTGMRSDIPALLTLSDVVAIPSLWEGGPITLFEAMNLSKPVVGTPVGLMGEVIIDGETGFQIEPHSVDALAKKLLLLLQNPKLAQRMGDRAQEICQHYDLSHSVQRLSKMYQKLEYQHT